MSPVSRRNLRCGLAAEGEATQLRREVGAGREDHDRQLGLGAPQLGEDGEPVDVGEKEVEDDEVVVCGPDAAQRLLSVGRGVDAEPLGFEPAREKREDPRLVLRHQNSHSRGDHNPGDAKMTGR